MSEISIAQKLERQSVIHMDCTIPPEMTIKEWRRLRSARSVVPLRAASAYQFPVPRRSETLRRAA